MEVVWNLSLSLKPTVGFLDAVSVFPIVGLTETATDFLEAHLESMANGSARECYDGAPLLTTPGQRADFERAIISVASRSSTAPSTAPSLNSSTDILEAVELPHYRSALSAGMGWKTDALDKWALWRNLGDGDGGGGGFDGGGGGGAGGEVAAPLKSRPLIWGSVTCAICFDEVNNPALGNALEGCGHWCW